MESTQGKGGVIHERQWWTKILVQGGIERKSAYDYLVEPFKKLSN
jgi:hypothetical protein